MTSTILIVAVVGLVALLLVFLTIRRKDQGFGPNNTRLVCIIVVVTLTVILAIDKPEYDSAVIGLLGAIIGYLFGIKIESSSECMDRSPTVPTEDKKITGNTA